MHGTENIFAAYRLVAAEAEHGIRHLVAGEFSGLQVPNPAADISNLQCHIMAQFIPVQGFDGPDIALCIALHFEK